MAEHQFRMDLIHFFIETLQANSLTPILTQTLQKLRSLPVDFVSQRENLDLLRINLAKDGGYDDDSGSQYGSIRDFMFSEDNSKEECKSNEDQQ